MKKRSNSVNTSAEKAVEEIQPDLPGMPFFYDTPAGASGMLLRTASSVFSRWFSAIKGAVSRERTRQAAYRVENGLGKKAKVPSNPLVQTDYEKSVSESSESVIRSMFGDKAADYAKVSFDKAMATGDMRSFKIRLLMLKARDSLSGTLYEEFSRYADIYISEAEKLAGCTPCPGPRRMSRAEAERRRARESICNDTMPLFGYNNNNNQEFCEDKCGRKGRVALPNSKILNVIRNKNNSSKQKSKIDIDVNAFGRVSVTVTHTPDASEMYDSPPAQERLRNEYLSEKQIVEDIKSGKVSLKDKKPSDIVAEMKRGVISPSEAIMFMSIIGKMNEVPKRRKRIKIEEEFKRIEEEFEEDEDDICDIEEE